jgi:hypothetical protein
MKRIIRQMLKTCWLLVVSFSTLLLILAAINAGTLAL